MPIRMTQHGDFDPSLKQLAIDELLTEFSESFDFARCQRPDGSFYGISEGLQCRKGTKAASGEKYEPKRKKSSAPSDTAQRMAAAYERLKQGRGQLAIKSKIDEKAIKPVEKAGSKQMGPSSKKIVRPAIKPETKKRLAELSPEKLEKLSKMKLTPTQKTAVEEAKTQKVSKSEKDDKSLEKVQNKGKKVIEGIKGFDSEKAFAEATYELGSGAMGVAKLSNGPPPGVVKKGEIGEFEVEAMKRLEGLSVVPKFHGATVESKSEPLNPNVGSHVRASQGTIGVARANGYGLAGTYIDKDYETRAAVVDNYIRARKDIHLKGVAHNDMHDGNIFYSEKSNAFQYPRGEKATMQVIDFGLSQIGYRAALLEALHTTRNDFQATDFLNEYSPKKSQGDLAIDRLKSNEKSVISKLESRGVKDRVLFGSIRSKQSEIDRMFGDLTEKEAEGLVKELYEGV